jgi:hypothetical protein
VPAWVPLGCRRFRWHEHLAPKKLPRRGGSVEVKSIYFFTQAGLVSFSFLLQSTFLSSILPPPCEPAKAGMDTSMKAETRAVITNFIEAPSRREVEKKGQNCELVSTPTHAAILSIIKGTC